MRGDGSQGDGVEGVEAVVDDVVVVRRGDHLVRPQDGVAVGVGVHDLAGSHRGGGALDVGGGDGHRQLLGGVLGHEAEEHVGASPGG